MKKQLSIITSAVILSTSFAYADSASIDEAFKNGTVSGSLTAYGIEHDGKGGVDDENTGIGTINVAYETASYMGLSAKAAFEAGHEIASDSFLNENAMMTEAYIKYANNMFSITAGRQAIDLEWMSDYHEAVVAAITAIPDTTIVLGYSNQFAEIDEDTIDDFAQIGTDGAYVADIKYTGLSGFEFNPYYYSVPNTADWYGLKTTYSSDMFGAIAQYAVSSEETQPDGSIGHVEVNGTLDDVTLAVGYIQTDDNAGAGSMTAVGDNITPFDYGEDNYKIDAKTTYGYLGYTIAGVELGALYGETDFDTNSESSELNLMAGYSFNDSLSLGLLYVDYDSEGSSNDDYKEYSATLAYTF